MKYTQKGQTLIEAVVALAIIMLVMSSISTVIATSLFNSQFIKEQNIANKYSQEGMEIVRGMQRSNLVDFATLSGNFCIDDNSALLPITAGPGPCRVNLPNTPFTPLSARKYYRVISLQKSTAPTDKCVKDVETHVTVTTSWNSSKCGTSAANKYCHSAKVESCLVHDTGISP